MPPTVAALGAVDVKDTDWPCAGWVTRNDTEAVMVAGLELTKFGSETVRK